MSKRGNGEGSLYPSGGVWIAAYMGPDGKRRRLKARTRAEAAKRLNVALKAREDGTLILGRRQTLAAYLEGWLRDSVKPRVRARTFAGYQSIARVHIVPELGRIALDRLSPADVQRLLIKVADGGSSPRNVQYVRAVLRSALEQALRWGMVNRNAAALVNGPRVERHEIRPFDPEEARAFLAAVRGERLECLFSTALTLGLRQGEALGLRWEDVDLDAGTVYVRNQLQRIDYRLQLVPTKTARSRRTLALPDSIVGSLRAHRERQAVELGALPGPGAFVFSTAKGTPLEARNVVRSFKAALAKAGLRDIRFHDLRHSCATLLLVQGVSPRVVMEILGHSQISLTMNTYSHVVPELGREAARRIDALLAGGLGPNER